MRENVLFKSRTAAKTWTAVGGDLTRNDKKRRNGRGPITGDNTGGRSIARIRPRGIAEAEGPAWAGSDDGPGPRHARRRQKLDNVTANLKGLRRGHASAPSAVALRRDTPTSWWTPPHGRMRPYCGRTTDGGKSGHLSAKLPQEETTSAPCARTEEVRDALPGTGTASPSRRTARATWRTEAEPAKVAVKKWW